MNLKVENKIIAIHETNSTNNYANRLLAEAKQEVPDGTVVLAYNQKRGRGQLSNFWESEDGKNLTFSIILRPDFIEITDQFMISKVAALGASSVLKPLVAKLKIKWPNDIYAGDKKLGGILIENSIISGRITCSIIGIGINVNQEQFVSNAPNPVSLKQLTGNDFELIPLLDKIITGIKQYYKKLKDGCLEEINQHFLNEMYRLDTECYYKCKDGIFLGTIIGVNEIGQLMIRRKEGDIREYHFKEVEFII